MLKEFKEFAVKGNMLDMAVGIINALISFLIVAWAVFFVVRGFNKMKKEEEVVEEAPAEPEPTVEETLLTEIRDLLKAQG